MKLIGDDSKQTPRDAIGSTVFVTTGTLRRRYDVTSGGSYASQSSQVIHVGLGESSKIDNLEVNRANGPVEKFPVDKIKAILTIRQGNSGKK